MTREDKIRAKAVYMQEASIEVTDAIKARVGAKHAEKYVQLVQETAAGCAAIKAAILALKSPVAEKSLTHCAAMMVAFSMQNVMEIFSTTSVNDPRVTEFTSDVLSLTKFLFQVVPPEQE